MNTVKYVEVNAQMFLSGLFQIMEHENLMEDLLKDERYILRISPNAIEIAYPEDKPFITS